MTLTPTTAPSGVDPLDLQAARRHVETVLEEFLRRKAAHATGQGLPSQAVTVLSDFCAAGGKRLRPMLCLLGWHAAGGPDPAPRAVVQVAAALEMFHAFALIHDDVMDGSDTRRGRPTVHRALAAQYAAGRPRQAADRTGTSAAVLIGDLALCWSDELIHTAGLTPDQLDRLLPVLDVMRTEVMHGQYLDVTSTGRPTHDVERALAIIRYKTAKYTIERPLHIGAVLADASQPLLDALTAYALPLGEAFQLRDDLLGVFGDPALTGKSRLDDLRTGKHTTLIALALRDAEPHHANHLRRLLGHPGLTEADATQIRAILTVTGARSQTETMITQRRETVLQLLASPGPIHPTALRPLHRLADTTTRRNT